MSALYPLRMNSKYQTEIAMLESMGFDGNKAAQYLEEDNGNTVRVIEKLLQSKQDQNEQPDDDHFGFVHEHEPNASGEASNEEEDDDDQEEEEEEEEEDDVEEHENEANAVIVSYHDQLSRMVDEMMADLADFFKEVPLNLVCSKLMIVFWCILVVVIPVILLHHSCEHGQSTQTSPSQPVCHNNTPIQTNPALPLQNNYVYIMSNKYREYMYMTADGNLELGQNKTGQMAIWKLEVHENTVKIQNKDTRQYVRLHWGPHPNVKGKKVRAVDCTDVGDVRTVFDVLKFEQIHDKEFSMSLRSHQVGNSHLGFGSRSVWNFFANIRHVQPSYSKPVWIVQAQSVVMALATSTPRKSDPRCIKCEQALREEFTTPYSFEEDILFGNDEVIIKHLYHFDSYLQLASLSNEAEVSLRNEIKTEGGIWSLQRFQNEQGGEALVKVRNLHSGKYLRILGNEVNAAGSGGKHTVFRVIVHRSRIGAASSAVYGVTLESVQSPGKCIAFRAGAKVQVTQKCVLDTDTWLVFMTRARSLEAINAKNERLIHELQRQMEQLEIGVQTAYRKGWSDAIHAKEHKKRWDKEKEEDYDFDDFLVLGEIWSDVEIHNSDIDIELLNIKKEEDDDDLWDETLSEDYEEKEEDDDYFLLPEEL